jgi:hypothetical protein
MLRIHGPQPEKQTKEESEYEQADTEGLQLFPEPTLQCLIRKIPLVLVKISAVKA